MATKQPATTAQSPKQQQLQSKQEQQTDTKSEDFKFVPDPYPFDEDGFAQAFSADQPAQLKAAFERYGVVVLKGALSEEEIERTKKDIWQIAGFPNGAPGFAELDKTPWEAVSGSRYNSKRGFLGYEPSWSEAAWRNRVNKNLYSTYSLLFDRPDLIIKLDRYGLMRPTVFPDADGGEKSRPDWQTESQWLHWDQNPWHEPDFVRIQMVLALSPHTSNSGGFHCIAGFPGQWKKWAAANLAYGASARALGLVDVPREDPIRLHTQRITMRPGSALLWDSRTPHGNFPNTSTGWRMCQYMGFHPAPTSQHDAAIMRNRIYEMQNLAEEHRGVRRIPAAVTESPVNRKLIGLEAWDGDRKPHVLTEFTLSQIGLRRD